MEGEEGGRMIEVMVLCTGLQLQWDKPSSRPSLAKAIRAAKKYT